MKILVSNREFQRLKKLDKLFEENSIPFQFRLKYSKTDGYIIEVHGDASTDWKRVAIWPLFADFEPLVEMLDRELKREALENQEQEK